MTDLTDHAAEALWIAFDPFRLDKTGRPVPVTWADADDLDRDLYRHRARTVIEELGLTGESRYFDGPFGQGPGDWKCRFVSKWWEAS